MKLHFSNGLRRAILAGLAVTSAAWAGPVSATPGVIQGVVTLIAPTAADALTVDARDSSNIYTAHANAAQNDPSLCAAGSQNWCYSMVVESALASGYYLRPIALISKSSPAFIANTVPFPPTSLVPITAGATVPFNINYQPGEISGSFQAYDMGNNALQLSRLYLSTFDLSNTFAEPCIGSIEFCPSNSVFQWSPAIVPLPADYQLFLKPADNYNYLTRAFGIQETGGARTTVQFDSNQALGATPAAGVNVTRNYTFHQVASVGGSLSAPGQSIYGFQVGVVATSNTGNTISEGFGPVNNSATPLSASTYLARIFDFTDFTKPIYIQPQLTLSADGRTLLQYPATLINPNLAVGEQRTLDFSGTSASIGGRVTFDPPYPAGNIYPGVQAETVTPSGAIGVGQTTLASDAQGGTYTLPAFGGTWQYWRFGWDFDLGNPNLKSNYFVGQFLTAPVTVADGQALTGNNFSFDTARVKVFFSAPTGTTITDPQLAITTGNITGGNFTPDFGETGHSEGLNYNAVAVGESDAVLRVHGTPFRLTPSAVINTQQGPGTGRTDFSPIVLTPHKGDVIIVGVPGSLSLTVNAPTNGQTFNTCQIPVSGSATGAQNITITVNGQPVQTTSANNPDDVYQVVFSTTIGGSGANTQVVVRASAPGNTSVMDTRTVSASSPTVNTGANVSTSLLWPPNHDLINVGLTATAQSGCDAHPVLGVTVYSNESDVDETGTGNFSPDAANLAPGTLRLRAERVAAGQGRVYLIVARGTAQGGGSGYACTTVVVPHDQSTSSIALVNSMAAAAANSCGTNGLPPAGYVAVGTGAVIGPKQ